jgi:hypothetical protein
VPEAAEELVQLAQEIPLTYSIIEANQPGGDICKGTLTKLSRKGAEARLENPVDTFSNLEMHLMGKEGQKIPGTLYGKVIGTVPGTGTVFSVCFTSIPPEIEAFFSVLLAQPAGVEAESMGTKKPKRRRTSLPKDGRALPPRPTVS